MQPLLLQKPVFLQRFTLLPLRLDREQRRALGGCEEEFMAGRDPV